MMVLCSFEDFIKNIKDDKRYVIVEKYTNCLSGNILKDHIKKIKSKIMLIYYAPDRDLFTIHVKRADNTEHIRIKEVSY